MSKAAATQYLDKHGSQYRVQIIVPKRLRAKIGRAKLLHPLHTDSLKVANRLKPGIVANLKAQIAEAGRVAGGDGDSALAAEIAALRIRAEKESPELLGDICYELDLLAAQVAARSGEDKAADFVAVAQGRAVPIDLHHAQFLDQVQVKLRTKKDHERAVGFLLAWCRKEGIAATLQAIDRKTAARFLDGFRAMHSSKDTVTLQKYIHRLSVYWRWLEKREEVDLNVWHGLTYFHAQRPHDELERPFTDDEMVKLLTGPAPPKLQDAMQIGALTGARLDAIVSLRAGDIEEHHGILCFKFAPQKRERKPRLVPVHSELREIVTRRTEGKRPDENLFPEWPPVQKVGSQRERSFKASNQFTAYRRSVGVDERVEGKRRALVNYHSFRRWFITKAEQADQPEHIIQIVVGHRRAGMTLGVYSAGPLLTQARRCIEAVQLPC